MLRIEIEHDPGGLTLRLKGKLAHPWVNELIWAWTELAPAQSPSSRIAIDLRAVAFVDTSGEALLGALQNRGCEIRRGAPSVAPQLGAVEAEPATGTAMIWEKSL